MNLSSKEKKFYENVFTKLKGDNQPLNEKTCYKLIERGVDDPEICNKVIEVSKKFPLCSPRLKTVYSKTQV